MACSAVQMEPTPVIDKQQVAHSFSRAAGSYDGVAALQRRIGQGLLQRTPDIGRGRVLDLGCGTGYFTAQLAARAGNAEVVALDLAEGMLEYARGHRGADRIHWLCGDAEQLPLADDSLDGVFTSLAIQWCEDLPRLFAEIRRVLRPGGRLAFATLGPDTLWQLRRAWQQVDDFVHVNRFAARGELMAALAGRLEPAWFEEEQVELRYDALRQLTGELKGLGAHNVNAGRHRGLSGRQRIQAFREAYEGFRNAEGQLPATYQVFYGLVTKA